MTVHLARRFPDSEIYAFEPVPYNLNTLKRIIKHYRLRNVIIKETALGDFNGTVQMVVPTLGKAKQHGLSHVVDASITSFNEGETVSSPITRLDDIAELNRLEICIAAIKLDVENFEYRVLKGGEGLIAKHKPIIYCELWENENREQCLSLMQSLGYTVYILEKKKLVIFNPQSHATQNFFFIYKTREVKLS
jgi:FkbM family methyltransferase